LGAPVLRERAAEVEVVDDDVRRLVRDMFDTMYAANGQGLAAPQVGVSRRIIVLDVPQSDAPAYALVNPRIVERRHEAARAEEGCLSIPGVADVGEPPAEVGAAGLDGDG